eukprot:TRINITY_DN63131_c0_g1_i1.p2 TRINITY_DN63131_c0_g1~~TRINITY_DN63131_c0_g1_i1.p2  ORF type:complete len:161 (+),score=57.40 TRINITY_DN63131_c0_g1_i1:55-483(+)
MAFANKKFQPLGDQKAVPFARRLQVALFVLPEGEAKAVYLFFDKEWSVGRCLDSGLSLAGVPNPNLSTTDPAKRLALFSLKTRKMLPNASNITTVLGSGEAVVATFGTGLPAWVAVESLRYTSPAPEFEKEAKKKMRECCLM